MPQPVADTSELITYWHEQEIVQDATSGDYETTRTRCRRAIQQVVTYIWNYGDWVFKYVTSTETVAASGNGTLPANFTSWGKWGGCFPTDGSFKMTWVPYAIYQMYKRRKPSETGRPKIYTDAELDTSTSPPRRKVLFYPMPDASTGFTYVYEREPPHIDDAAAGGGPNTATDELNLLPRQWLEGPLMEGLRDHYMRDDANAQSISEQRQRFMDSLKSMLQNEQAGRHVAHHLPPFGRRRRRGGI